MTRNSALTENTKLPFGKHKRKRIRECPDSYLRWVTENLLDTDFHEYAFIAKKVLEKREREEAPVHDLNMAADEFLRNHGYNPRKLY